ncbi:MAG: aminoacyl-tRNA hydrolase [Candidatus Baltobacteraceae bacterium]
MAGLGNPGPRYQRTRHNVGFRVVEEVARRLGVTSWREKDGAAQCHLAARKLVLVEPLSYMNESGRPLARIAAWWKVAPAELLVVSDDLDLPFGRLRMRRSGGSGGHNGLKSVIEHFGEGFPRLRVGIGRGAADDAIDHVLSTFDALEEQRLGEIVEAAARGVLCWLDEGGDAAMNLVNGWQPSWTTQEPPRAS